MPATVWRSDEFLTPGQAHYKVIYADPPWTFSTYSRKGKGLLRLHDAR